MSAVRETANGYTVRIEDAARYREGDEKLFVPAAAFVEPADDSGIEVMIGRSPVDSRIVIHIDGEIGEGKGMLARVYLNDTLVAGEEA